MLGNEENVTVPGFRGEEEKVKTSSPHAGQILVGRFPEMEHVFADECGKAGRPCLVLEVTDEGYGVGPEVLVAYGTSQHTERQGCGEFVLSTQEAPFLRKTTKFCLQRRLWLPLSRFTSGGKLSVAGQLPRTALARVQRAAVEAQLI